MHLNFEYDINLQPKEVRKAIKYVGSVIKSGENCIPILLVGNAGIGKTSTGHYLADKYNLDLLEINLTSKRITNWIKSAETFCSWLRISILTIKGCFLLSGMFEA